jgi:hypothetical protein
MNGIYPVHRAFSFQSLELDSWKLTQSAVQLERRRRGKEIEMKKVLLAAIAVAGFAAGIAVTAPSPAQAGQMPVCMHQRDISPDCRYTSMAQCMATAAGIGGDCLANPAYYYAQTQNSDQPVRARKLRRYDQ